MDKLGEIISHVERRRKWTAEQKAKILTEALKPGATVSAVADRNGISRSQLYAWKKLAQRGGIPGISLNGEQEPLFAPVRIEAMPAAPAAAIEVPVAQLQRRAGVEIELTNGRIMRVEESIDPVKLGRLVAALDGRS